MNEQVTLEVDRVFDRIPHFDEHSRNYSAMDLPRMAGAAEKLRSYTWRLEKYLNQGEEGACVGHAWAHELAARPVVVEEVESETAFRIYRDAQKIDEWSGEAYEGTSVLAGAKATLAYLQSLDPDAEYEYRWGFGPADGLAIIGHAGPVVAGVWWYDGMLNTDEDGFIHRSGRRLGGHAILINGVKCVFFDKGGSKTYDNLDLDKSYVKLPNSWGQGWGENGSARMSVRDFAHLLSEDGEICIPVKRS